MRYHGAGSIVSQLYKDGLIEAQSVPQLETFSAGMMFAKSEGIIPAPESSHAIRGAIELALDAKKKNEEKTIIFNLSGHGLLDMVGYGNFLKNCDHPMIDV